MTNGALFDPDDKTLIISARIGDVIILPGADSQITIVVADLMDGIEIVNSNDCLWWPV